MKQIVCVCVCVPVGRREIERLVGGGGGEGWEVRKDQ